MKYFNSAKVYQLNFKIGTYLHHGVLVSWLNLGENWSNI